MAFSASRVAPQGYGMGPSSGHVRVSYSREPNFLQRVGGSMCGSVIGLGLIAVSCLILFTNEVSAERDSAEMS